MSYVNIKRKLCVVREEAGMSQKELVEYANKRQNEKMKEINVTIQQIKNYKTENTAIPDEIFELNAEEGKSFPKVSFLNKNMVKNGYMDMTLMVI